MVSLVPVNPEPQGVLGIDEIEKSFLANIERGEQALEAAENDYQRLEVRDAARAAQVVTAVMGRKHLVRRFSVLVQRAERAIAKANPPMPYHERGILGNDIKNGRADKVEAIIPQGTLGNIRAAHAHISDAEFEAIVTTESDEPLTRQFLLERSRLNNKESEISFKHQWDKDAERDKERSRHLEQGTGNNERYTPAHIIQVVRKVVGDIELDPASSATANEIIQAQRYYTVESNGLAQDWTSETLWMNPPYSRGDIDAFVEKLTAEVKRGAVQKALVITHNATETRWCRALLDNCAAFCLLKERVDFSTPGEQGSGTLRGQIVFLLGDTVRSARQGGKADWNWVERFNLAFSELGEVCIPISALKEG